MYFVLAAICIHFLLRRGIKSPPQIIIFVYTLLMFFATTIYFVSACAWSEVEFVEATVNVAVYDTRTSTRLSLLKDTSYIVNIWLADSLLVLTLYKEGITMLIDCVRRSIVYVLYGDGSSL